VWLQPQRAESRGLVEGATAFLLGICRAGSNMGAHASEGVISRNGYLCSELVALKLRIRPDPNPKPSKLA
jgi:hypothetical protein